METRVTKDNYLIKTLLFVIIGLVALALSLSFATKTKAEQPHVYALTAEETLAAFDVGFYRSGNLAHLVEVKADGSILFDNTYLLTANLSDTTYTISGIIGETNANISFTRLNNHVLILAGSVKYHLDGEQRELYGGEPFVCSFTPTEDASGALEVWKNNTKLATFADFQSAIEYASAGCTIEVTRNFKITEGAAVSNKNITINGNYHTLDKSEFATRFLAVAEGATLTINDLTIDGGATKWAVAFDKIPYDYSFTIPFVENSRDGEPETKSSTISSNGKLITNNLSMNNIYAPNLYGSSIIILKGEAEINNSSFEHNFSSGAGVMYLGSNVLEENPTAYPVTKVAINNSTFMGNSANGGDGGAIMSQKIGEFIIQDCNFEGNVTHGNSSGGAIHFTSGGGENTLPYPQAKVDNTTFRGNFAGNDAFAIMNNAAEFTITNTHFVENVGVHMSSSVGSVVHALTAKDRYPVEIFDGCVFERNRGPISCIGDFASQVDIRVLNTQFIENEGDSSLLLYTGVATFENCHFENEIVKTAVIRIPSYHSNPNEYIGSGYTCPTIKIKDVTMTGANNFDIYANHHQNGENCNDAEIYISGTTTANIKLKQKSKVYINGSLTGDISLDENSPPEECVIVGAGSNFDGTIGQFVDIRMEYTYGPDNTATSKTLTFPYKKNTTPHEVSELLGENAKKDGYILKLYTDNSYTTEWDYTCNSTTTLYGSWAEHAHNFANVISIDHCIYSACTCGKSNGSLELVQNDTFVYDGTPKTIEVADNLEKSGVPNTSDTNYTITYYKKLADNQWIIVTEAINAGTYRVLLMYKGHTAELEFEIDRATIDMSGVKFSSKTIKYTGKEQVLEIEGTLPNGVSVVYKNNRQTEAGEYEATAIFVVDEENYYPVQARTATFRIEPVGSEGGLFADINWIQCGISAGVGALVMLLFSLTFSSVRGGGRKRERVNTKYYYEENPNAPKDSNDDD